MNSKNTHKERIFAYIVTFVIFTLFCIPVTIAVYLFGGLIPSMGIMGLFLLMVITLVILIREN